MKPEAARVRGLIKRAFGALLEQSVVLPAHRHLPRRERAERREVRIAGSVRVELRGLAAHTEILIGDLPKPKGDGAVEGEVTLLDEIAQGRLGVAGRAAPVGADVTKREARFSIGAPAGVSEVTLRVEVKLVSGPTADVTGGRKGGGSRRGPALELRR